MDGTSLQNDRMREAGCWTHTHYISGSLSK